MNKKTIQEKKVINILKNHDSFSEDLSIKEICETYFSSFKETNKIEVAMINKIDQMIKFI